MGRLAVHVEPGVEMSRALVLVGTPSMGLVGAIVAQHLVRTLQMQPVGRLESPDFPPVVLVKDGRVRPLVQVYVAPAECRRGVSCSRLVVVASELTPEDERAREFARAILEWARAMHAPMVVVPDGLAEDGEPGRQVVGVASTEAARAFLDAIELDPMDEGALGGVTAALLEEGERAGVPVVSMLGETASEQPDARAAAAIITVLGRILPGLPLDPAPLLAEAEAIERAMRETMEKAKGHGDESAPMFG